LEDCPMATAIREGRPIRGAEAVLERPDGTRVPYTPFPTPLFDTSGKIAGAINVLIDISDRRQADIRSALLAAIGTNSDDAVIGKTLNGIITAWNAGASRIFGYSEKEMIGQSILRLIPPELHEEEAQILAQLKQGKRIEHFET